MHLATGGQHVDDVGEVICVIHVEWLRNAFRFRCGALAQVKLILTDSCSCISAFTSLARKLHTSSVYEKPVHKVLFDLHKQMAGFFVGIE